MKALFAFLLALAGLTFSASADTILRNGDILEMRIGGAPAEFLQEFHQPYTVDNGMINVPIIGRVRAAGLSSSQLQAAVEKIMVDKKIFTNPTVIINVGSTRVVVIGGAVRAPGRQPWNSDMTMSQAIMAAGGPSEWAKDKVRVVRGGVSETFSRKAISKDPTKDPKIQPGDFVEVSGDAF